jgi:hypothetical protein
MKAWNDSEVSIVEESIALGMPLKMVARRLGRTMPSVMNACRLYGFTLGVWARDSVRMALHMPRADYTRLQAEARKYDVKVGTLCRLLLSVIARDRLSAAILDLPEANAPAPPRLARVRPERPLHSLSAAVTPRSVSEALAPLVGGCVRQASLAASLV